MRHEACGRRIGGSGRGLADWLLVVTLISTAVAADGPTQKKVTTPRAVAADGPTQKKMATPRAVAADGPTRKKAAPTYAKDVAPILQAKCLNCHRRHQVGPFPLETYEQARKRAHDIANVTEERSMPPWKPTRGVGPKLKHDQSLSHEQVAVISAWVEAGAPFGDTKDLPPLPKFAEGWKLGPPDVVLEPVEDFPVAASGPDTYRCFVLPTNLANDTFLEAIDYQAGSPSLVHHVISYVDTSGLARRLDEADNGPGYTSSQGGGGVDADELGFWTAGSEPHRMPDGIGIRMPRRADIILQVHYHPNGKPGVDRTRVGLYFARKPVKQAVHWNNASCYNFRLPAGASNVEVKASWYVPVALEALAVAPHMHLLGRDMEMTLVYPDGTKRDLIHIAAWDPSWQGAYFFQKPLPVPAGSTIKVVAHFDNSAHPRNPSSPPKLVRYGPNAEDEMCVGYIAVVKKGQDLTIPGATDDLFELFKKQRDRNLQRDRIKAQR